MVDAPEEVDSETYLQLRDLRQMGVCSNWTTLGRYIRERGFPVGLRIGKRTRLFPKSKVMAWLKSQEA